MSIISYISAAKLLLENNYYSEALCLVCNAVDKCASLKFPNQNGTNRYKNFLSDNFNIISEYGFPGIGCLGMKIKINTDIHELKPDKNGYVFMEQIIYHVIRCELTHDCEIHPDIVFVDETIVPDWNKGKFYLPKALIFGLIKAVEKNMPKS